MGVRVGGLMFSIGWEEDKEKELCGYYNYILSVAMRG